MLASRIEQRLFLPTIILIEGFASIAAEILVIRQLLPVAGSSVIVTSLIIGIFLLFLALGYRQGGRATDNLQSRLCLNFQIASCWFGIGLSYFFIYYFFYYIQKITGTHVIYPLLAYLLIIVAPLIFILGQTVPITMSLARADKSVGAIGGDTLGVSTIGSFLGAILTSLLLMQFLGVAWTVLVVFLLLVGLTLLLTPRQALLKNSLIAAAALLSVYALNISVEKSNFVLTNNYANYRIFNSHNSDLKSDEKVLEINQSISSYINKNLHGFPYIEMIKKILFTDLKLVNSHILVLGAGGFTLSAENAYGNHFTYVDIDKQIKQVVTPAFLNQINGEFVADDARHFVHDNNHFYEAIISDAYSNIENIPAYLLTVQYMRDIKNRLTNNGVAIFNIIANPMLADSYSKRIDNTIRAVFGNCMVTPLNYIDAPTNIIYICKKADNEADNKIYTDNLNTSTTDSFAW